MSEENVTAAAETPLFRRLPEARGERFILHVDGVAVEARDGDSVAAVLLRETPCWSRTNPVSGTRRAPYCMMGVCFECLAVVDGVPSVQTCLVQARPGMVVERQVGPAGLP